MGGTMRLGAQPAKLVPGSVAQAAYGCEEVRECHRHRYEFNNTYRQQFEANGMRFSGTSPDGGLVEIIELPDRPWFVAVQFHPEFKSKPTAVHPRSRALSKLRSMPRAAAKESECGRRNALPCVLKTVCSLKGGRFATM